MWCTSRASPDSTTRPTWVRVFSRTRWWWTAAVSSREGIGASSVVELRSESTMMFAPSAMAAEWPGGYPPGPRPGPDRLRGGVASPAGMGQNSPSMAKALKPGVSAVLVDVEQLGQVVVVDDRVGKDDLAARAGLVARAGSPRARAWRRAEVTSSSRMASRGGLVT